MVTPMEATSEIEQRFLKRFAELSEVFHRDPESGHSKADELLMELVTQSGYEKVVAAYTALEPKWYA